MIYGRYTASGQSGLDVDLDLCGGHSHDSYGYHYHPDSETRSGSSSLASRKEDFIFKRFQKCFFLCMIRVASL